LDLGSGPRVVYNGIGLGRGAQRMIAGYLLQRQTR
jgi:hypothetical protein